MSVRWPTSQSGWVVEKHPGNSESAGKLRGQRLDPKGLRGVVAAVNDVEAEFFRGRERPVWTFARDERVRAFLGGLAQFTAGAARDHTDAPANLRTGRNGPDRIAGCPG